MTIPKAVGKELITQASILFMCFIAAILGYLLCLTPIYAIISPLKIVSTLKIGIELGTEVWGMCGVNAIEIFRLLYKVHSDNKKYPQKAKLPRWLTLIRVTVFLFLFIICFGIGVNIACENASLQSIAPKDNDCISEEQKTKLVEEGFTVNINPSVTYCNHVHETPNEHKYIVRLVGDEPKSIIDIISTPLISFFEWKFDTVNGMTIYLDPIYANPDNIGSDNSLSEDSTIDNSGPSNTETDSSESSNESKQEHHFVILYDVSNSMDTSDSNGWVKDSVAQFINNIDSSMFPIKLAIQPFAGNCPEPNIMNQIYGGDWIYLETRNVDELDKLTDKIQSLEYVYSYTDIGKAFEKCNRLLKDMSEGVENYSQMVLFITDGFIDTHGKGNEKFANIADSYNRVITAADEFPDDTLFVGIVPDDSMRKSHLTFGSTIDENNNREVKRYYSYEVPPTYAYKVESYTKCVSTFIEKLKARQNGRVASNVYKINWADKNVSNEIDIIYKKIFEDEFNTKTSIFPEKDLDSGVSFNVPGIVNSLTINIRSGADDSQRQMNDIARWRDKVSIVYNGSDSCEFNVSATEYAIIISIENVSPGIYTLKCSDARSSMLMVNAYGNINISTDGKSKPGTVNEKITFNGTVDILEDYQKYITVEVYDNLSDEKISEIYTSEYKNGKWSVSFVPAQAKEYSFVMKFIYDDTNLREDPMGISIFQTTEVFTVNVTSEVSIAPDPPPVPEPEPNPKPDENSTLDFLQFIKAYWQICAVVIIIITIFAIKSRIRYQLKKQVFEVRYPNGVKIKYRFVKSNRAKKYRKFKEYEFKIRNTEKECWEYSSRGNKKTIESGDIIEL